MYRNVFVLAKWRWSYFRKRPGTKSMCNRLKSVNSKRKHLTLFFASIFPSSENRAVRRRHCHHHHQLTSSLLYRHHIYCYRCCCCGCCFVAWNTNVSFLYAVFGWFCAPSSSVAAAIFSLSFYLFTFSIFIFIHSQQLGLPLSEQLIFMCRAR